MPLTAELQRDFYDYNNKDRNLVVALSGNHVRIQVVDLLGELPVDITKDDAIKLAKYLLDLTGTNIYHESMKILTDNNHRLIKEGLFI